MSLSRIPFKIILVAVAVHGIVLPPTLSAAPPNVRLVARNAPAGGDGLTWGTAFNDLQEAIAAATYSPGAISELWVKRGTYLPARSGSSEPFATFTIWNGLSIYGGFKGGEIAREERDPVVNVTVLSGDLGGIDKRVYRVVTVRGVGCVLDGVTISGGYGINPFGLTYGAGLLVIGDATLRRCVIRDNLITGFHPSPSVGAGVFCDVGSTLLMEDCEVRDNGPGPVYFSMPPLMYGGGIAANFCSIQLERCVFRGNQASQGLGVCASGVLGGSPGGHGGALFLSSCTAVINDCVFLDNQAGSGGTQPTCAGIQGGGTAGGAGGVLYSIASPVAFARCTFSNNAAGDGANGGTSADGRTGGHGGPGGSGGVVFARQGSSISMVNCLLTGSRAGSGGRGGFGSVGPGGGGPAGSGGAVWSDGALYLTNATVADNATGVAGLPGIGGSFHGEAGRGAGLFASGVVNVSNSILWNSDTTECFIPDASTVTFSDVRGGFVGLGNISENPVYDVGGYQLEPLSPCIDAGDNDADGDPLTSGHQPLPDFDLLGASRRVDVNEVVDTGGGTALAGRHGRVRVSGPMPCGSQRRWDRRFRRLPRLSQSLRNGGSTGRLYPRWAGGFRRLPGVP